MLNETESITLCSDTDTKQLVVLSTAPVIHGYANDSSEVIIKKILSSAEIENNLSRVDEAFEMKPLFLSDFASDLSMRRIHHLVPNQDSSLLSDGRQRNTIHVNIIFDIIKFRQALCSVDQMSDDFDEYSTVIFNMKDASRLKIFNGSLLRLKSCLHSDTEVTCNSGPIAPRHLGRVVVAIISDIIQNSDSPAAISMLPCVWFNICQWSGQVNVDDYTCRLCSFEVSIDINLLNLVHT